MKEHSNCSTVQIHTGKWFICPDLNTRDKSFKKPEKRFWKSWSKTKRDFPLEIELLLFRLHHYIRSIISRLLIGMFSSLLQKQAVIRLISFTRCLMHSWTPGKKVRSVRLLMRILHVVGCQDAIIWMLLDSRGRSVYVSGFIGRICYQYNPMIKLARLCFKVMITLFRVQN